MIFQVGQLSAGASADQVQGIQRGSGWQARGESGQGRGIMVEDEGNAVRASGRVLAGDWRQRWRQRVEVHVNR